MIIPDWHLDLEDIATTEPNFNSALFNLPRLKGFISNFVDEVLDEKWKEIELVLAEEMSQCRKDGLSTSRLTSAFMKINAILK